MNLLTQQDLTKAFEEILAAKRCTYCVDQGSYPVEVGGCGPDGENDTREIVPQQCEWCYTTPDSLLNRIAAALEIHQKLLCSAVEEDRVRIRRIIEHAAREAILLYGNAVVPQI